MLLLIVLGALLAFNIFQKASNYLPIPKVLTGKVLNLDFVVSAIAFAIQLFVVFGLRL